MVTSRYAKHLTQIGGPWLPVTVLGTEVLETAVRQYGDLRKPIAAWLKVAKSSSWKHLVELRQTWRDTDYVDGQTVFNIKGNSYRMYALVNYEAQTIIVQKLTTHAEYSKK